jgi:hypothetical protein
LRLVLIDLGSVDSIKAGHKVEGRSILVGTNDEPDLTKIKGLLKQFGNKKTPTSFPFATK